MKKKNVKQLRNKIKNRSKPNRPKSKGRSTSEVNISLNSYSSDISGTQELKISQNVIKTISRTSPNNSLIYRGYNRAIIYLCKEFMQYNKIFSNKTISKEMDKLLTTGDTERKIEARKKIIKEFSLITLKAFGRYELYLFVETIEYFLNCFNKNQKSTIDKKILSEIAALLFKEINEIRI